MFRNRVLTALALALAIGSPAPSPAQAAPPRQDPEKYVFYLVASSAGDLGHICLGEPVVIAIKAERFLSNKTSTDTASVTNPPVQVFGVTLNGTVANPNYGTLSPGRWITSARSNPPGSAAFVFTPHSPGSTELVFKGTKIENGWFGRFAIPDRDFLSTTLDVTVEDCRYKVTAISLWTGSDRRYLATIDQAVLTADGSGHYQGTAIVQWVISEDHPRNGCPLHSVTTTSQADLTADMDKDGKQLVVDVAYQPAPLVWLTYRSDDCTRGSEIDSTNIPDPLTFNVPSTGGGRSLPQGLAAPGYGLFPGFANVTVIQVPDR